MGRLFRNMDPLKFVILFCLVACAGLGLWNSLLTAEFEDVQRSWRDAKRKVVDIHAILKEISTLYQAKDDQIKYGSQAGVYFENQLTEYGGIPHKAYNLKERGEQTVKIDGRKAIEYTQEIDFSGRGRGERLLLPRENWFRAFYNCERNSKRWRLRELHLKCEEQFDRTRDKDAGYPEELSDKWYVQRLVFASREPLSQ